MENILLPGKLCFHDRGLPDSLAYMRLSGSDETYAKEAVMRRKYNAVFLLDLLPFEKDYARTEDEVLARYIDQLIYQTYQELGYRVMRVPVVSVEDRSNIILQSLGLKTNKYGNIQSTS